MFTESIEFIEPKLYLVSGEETNKTKTAPLLHKVVFKKLTRDGASETSLLEPVKP